MRGRKGGEGLGDGVHSSWGTVRGRKGGEGLGGGVL